MRLDMGSMRFSAQVQQSPIPAEGNLIQTAWLKWYDVLPGPEPRGTIMQSWDTASVPGEANSFNVCHTFRRIGSKHYWLHTLREQMVYPDLKRRIVNHAQEWKAHTVLIEHAAAGAMLIQDLQEEYAPLDIIPIWPRGDKLTRMIAASATIEAGNLYLPTEASWRDNLLAELLQFPHSAKTDQIDALSQYLNWCRSNATSDGLYEVPRDFDSVQLFVKGERVY
jgi:predicted phage terminase large subunit-like protein